MCRVIRAARKNETILAQVRERQQRPYRAKHRARICGWLYCRSARITASVNSKVVALPPTSRVRGFPSL